MAKDQYPNPGTPNALPSLKFQLGKRDKQPHIGVTQGGSSKSKAAAVAGNDGNASTERDLFKPGKGGWGF